MMDRYASISTNVYSKNVVAAVQHWFALQNTADRAGSEEDKVY
jgi:hypothetical protein